METILTGVRGDTLLFDGKTVILQELRAGPAKWMYTAGSGQSAMGTVITGGTLGPREVLIRGVFLSDGASEAVREASLREWRHRLCRIAAPGEEFTLRRGDYSIRLVALGVPEFSTDPALAGCEASGFTLSAMAPDPRFFAEGEDFLSRSVSGKKLIFPVAFPPAGFVFGSVTEQDSLPVINRGDVASGGVITAKALGTAERFSITCQETGETFSLLTPLTSGETMVLDTREGRLSVCFLAPDGTKTEDFTRVNWASDFFRFPVGRTTLVWDTGGESDLVRLSVRLFPAYLSL